MAGGNALGAIIINEHTEIGITDLQRRMNHIASNDRIRVGLTDVNREMAHMAGCGNQLHDVAQFIIAVDLFMALRLNDR